MRRNGIIHARLTELLTELRHTELFAVTDSGLPAAGVEVVDLGVLYGLPEFLPVLRAILTEVDFEAAWGSQDVTEKNPEMGSALTDLVSPTLLPHEDFKAMIADCRFVVRTGEATPYANLILRSGVPW